MGKLRLKKGIREFLKTCLEAIIIFVYLIFIQNYTKSLLVYIIIVLGYELAKSIFKDLNRRYM